jgi:exopolyphosphatase / guanosine-5'-triphosphate,3'-diphosphate pyrophosphatase
MVSVGGVEEPREMSTPASPSPPRRVAAVDIGTNTVLLLVAERDADGSPRAVEERATITRLGQGVDATRTLAPEAVARTVACLEDYARAAQAAGAEAVRVVGTSAMRDAAGREQLARRVRELFGVEAEVLTGDEEAALTFRGALSGLRAPQGVSPGEVTVFDIGGGSTEIVTAAPGQPARFAHSYDVGSVRLTERLAPFDEPLSQGDRARLRRAALEALAGAPRLAAGEVPVGIAGTVTTLAAAHLGMEVYDGARVHGARLEVGELEAVVERLAGLTLADRKRVPGIAPARADVIVAGGYVVLAVLETLGATALRVSDRGVRWGLAHGLLG